MKKTDKQFDKKKTNNCKRIKEPKPDYALFYINRSYENHIWNAKRVVYPKGNYLGHF